MEGGRAQDNGFGGLLTVRVSSKCSWVPAVGSSGVRACALSARLAAGAGAPVDVGHVMVFRTWLGGVFLGLVSLGRRAGGELHTWGGVVRSVRGRDAIDCWCGALFAGSVRHSKSGRSEGRDACCSRPYACVMFEKRSLYCAVNGRTVVQSSRTGVTELGLRACRAASPGR